LLAVEIGLDGEGSLAGVSRVGAQKEEGPMNQPGASTLEPIVMGATNVALVEAAARDLEGFSEQVLTLGHSPSWGFPQVPDGLALCMGCWLLITAGQLGGERCPGTERQPAR
jgi:hypothetical protein